MARMDDTTGASSSTRSRPHTRPVSDSSRYLALSRSFTQCLTARGRGESTELGWQARRQRAGAAAASHLPPAPLPAPAYPAPLARY